MNGELLKLHLGTFVPLRIVELARAGRPADADFAWVQAWADELAWHGDELLFKSHVPGRTGDLMGNLVEAVAVMAFVPGGITIFGMHFEAQTGENDEET